MKKTRHSLLPKGRMMATASILSRQTRTLVRRKSLVPTRKRSLGLSSGKNLSPMLSIWTVRLLAAISDIVLNNPQRRSQTRSRI